MIFIIISRNTVFTSSICIKIRKISYNFSKAIYYIKQILVRVLRPTSATPKHLIDPMMDPISEEDLVELSTDEEGDDYEEGEVTTDCEEGATTPELSDIRYEF